MALILANSKYTYSSNGNRLVWGWADLFDGKNQKNDVMYDMLDYTNNQLMEQNLIAVFDKYDLSNEDSYYFSIFKYVQGYTNEDYSNNNVEGFGFIDIRVL